MSTIASPKGPGAIAGGGVTALDADGVLLDYNLAYADAWARAFGERPALRESRAYWAFDRWQVRKLDGDELALFRAQFDEEFWSTIPPIAGAVAACQALVNLGYELVCVTAMDPQFAAARLANLRLHLFPIDRVIAVAHTSGSVSPKAEAISELMPRAFVDDYLPYFEGVSASVHRALVIRDPVGTPNVGPGLDDVHSCHADLADFARWVGADVGAIDRLAFRDRLT